MSVTDRIARQFRTWQPGQPVAAAKLNAMLRGVVRSIRVGRGLRATTTADGEQVMLMLADEDFPVGAGFFFAKITSNAANGTGKWKYAWSEMEEASAGWQTKSGGRSGTTTTNFAVNGMEEVGSSSATVIPTNSVVLMRETKDTTGALAYRFSVGGGGGSTSIPLGTLQYQVYQMTSGSTAGWDFARAHS